MTFTDYRAAPGINISFLKGFAKSPAHALVQKPDTPAMSFGRAFHTYILEPDKFEERTVVHTGSETVTKNHLAKYPGKDVISASNLESLSKMRDSIRQHPDAVDALQGYIEKPLFWKVDGTACKGRPDVVNDDFSLIPDLKKCKDASPDAFRRQAHNLLYHWQAAFYVDGLKAITDHDYEFWFVCVEDTEPYGCAVYKAGPKFLELGRAGYRKALEQYNACKLAGNFPAYPKGVMVLEPPAWAFKNNEMEMEDDFDE
jgi:exodeoxyribonuclease VIII